MFWVKLFVLVALVLTSCVVNPAIRELSEEEDLELERQLKLMNKSPVKTVEVRVFSLIIFNIFVCFFCYMFISVVLMKRLMLNLF